MMLQSSVLDALAQKDTIIYIGDPMCSWCYGFSPELDKVMNSFVDVPVTIVVGGLRAHGSDHFTELKEFLTGHWKEVHHKSGQPFSYQILDRKNLIYDTEPACRAVVTMRKLKPSAEYMFFKDLQKAFYAENIDPTSITTFKQMASKHGIDENLFEKTFLSLEMIQETQNDFQRAQALQVHGFPSVIAIKDGKVYKISSGYLTADQMIEKLNTIGFFPSMK